jgi:hypothetical protein
MNQHEEKDLRENIRYLIRHVKEKRSNEEELLRTLVRELADYELQLLSEAGQVPDNSPTPNKSTGINVLEDLLKKIIPVLETDYKLLTTSEEQRQSFRSHIVQAVVSTLTPAITNNEATDDLDGEPELDEAINVDVGDDDEKFIDIRTDSEKVDDEEEVEENPVDSFGIEGEDETGRNMAYQSFKKIESSVIDSYELLSNAEDQELFYDYLIANLKLYFDKFETELADRVSEPTNQAYDAAKAEEEAVETGFDTGGAGEEEVELEL